jgi:hypothetical protein
MKLFKKLNSKEEKGMARIGLGFIRAKDYDLDKYGHLLMFSLNFKRCFFFKWFIPV